MTDGFTAMQIRDVDGKPHAGLTTITLSDLPDLDVLVEISHSSLNYKDGLAVSGKGRIARRLPMVGGIDLVGMVVDSRSPDWKPGDAVLVNGWGLSETEWGGFSRYARLRPEWLIALPDSLAPIEAMAIGTAGYTAALCVDALEAWGGLQDGPVLVTGAAGGVGSVATALLAALGCHVTAVTGRPETHDYLRDLGARDFLDRSALADKGRPLQAEIWSAAVDSVGSDMLVNVLAQMRYGAAVAACGLAAGADMNATVLPHILRSVALLGVDSVMAPQSKRQRAWTRLARDLDRKKLAQMTTVAPMTDLPKLADSILAGQIRGRVVIDVTA